MNPPVYCDDVVVAYHDFGQSMVCVRRVSTFYQVAFGEGVEAVCTMMVVLVG